MEGIFILATKIITHVNNNYVHQCILVFGEDPFLRTQRLNLECCFALDAGVDQQVTLPGHGQVGDGHWQGAVARRPQAAHVLSPPHCVDDHCPVLTQREEEHI